MTEYLIYGLIGAYLLILLLFMRFGQFLRWCDEEMEEQIRKEKKQ